MRAYLARRGLEDFALDTTPRYAGRPAMRARHLAPLTRLLERATREPVDAVISVPPRHGKTELLLHWFGWALQRDPTTTCAYVSYADTFAARKNRRAMAIAQRAGIALGDKQAANEWETLEGGLVRSTGILGQLTGDGFRQIVLDDPIKNREEAESPTMRDKIWDAVTSDLYTRQDPAGTSFILCGARWHSEDPAGRAIDEGWEHINIPAIDDEGNALWPEVWSLERLAKIRARIGEYAWHSLFLGRPQPRGSSVFGPETYYTEPALAYSVTFGIDLAYTAKTRADRSVSIKLGRVPPATPGADPIYHVLDVQVRQVRAPEFATVLRAHHTSAPGAPIWFYGSTTERGTADLLAGLGGIPVDGKLATADKFVRAQPVAAAWNQGRIRVPEPNAAHPWVGDFVKEVRRFTGADGETDDQVDALAAAFDAHGEGDVRAFMDMMCAA